MGAKYITFLLFITLTISFGHGDYSSIYDFANSDLAPAINDMILMQIESRLPGRSLEDFFQFQEVFDDETQNRTSCVVCKSFIAALKGLAAVVEWEDARDIVVDACYFLFENLTDEYVNTDELCPGIIDIQGPHVYEILQPKYRKSPEDICLNLNACFPPRQESFLHIARTTRSFDNQSGSRQTPQNGKSGKTLQQRKAEAITFVQMSDIHFELDYAEGSTTECGLSVCCQAKYGEGDAWLYGDYTCNIPVRTMELFFHKTVELNPNFVIYSGDTPPHTMWDESYSSQLNCTEVLIEKTRDILGEYRVYPNIGNHEMYPTNLFSIEYLQPYTQDMLDEFAEEWTDVAGFGEEQQESMRAGGYYEILLQPGLRLLSFNTNYWYSFNWYSTLNEGRAEVENMKQFIQDTLQLARENEEKVLLVGHHPPSGGDCIVSHTRDFEELIANYSDVIAIHIAGHTHYDHYKVFADDTGTALSMTFVNPSVTTNSNKNPSMRLYYLDPDTFEVIDFEQYGFNLREASESTEPPVIEFVYSAMEDYGLEDMSPSSWLNLTQRMMTDDELFGRYYYNFITGYNESATCEGTCKSHKICFSSFYSFDEVVYCMEEWEEVSLQISKEIDATSPIKMSRGLFSSFREFFRKAVELLRPAIH